LFGIIGSLRDKSKNRIASNSTDPGASTASPNTLSRIDLALGIPADFKPAYRVLDVKDESSATASRKVMNVSLPKGLDKAGIENNLRSAAKELYEEAEPDALIVYGYLEGRTTDSSNVIGQLTFAPYGDWARASERPSLDKYKAIVEGRNPYLPPIDEKPPGSDGGLEKQALAGNYQAQRNLGFLLSSGYQGYPANPVMGCAWHIVILKSRHPEVNDSDRKNKELECEQKLSPQQLREAEAESNVLLKRIKKR
jgi:hypothetical protein